MHDLHHCLFCGSQFIDPKYHVSTDRSDYPYKCLRRGGVNIARETLEDFEDAGFTDSEMLMVSMILRNEWEFTNKKRDPLTIAELRRMIDQFRPLDTLDKMDDALTKIERPIRFAGEQVTINADLDYPYYYCAEVRELENILSFLQREGLIS